MHSLRRFVFRSCVFIVLVAAHLAGGGAPAVRAQNEVMQAPTIAVIDMQRIMQESKAVQSIQQQINQQRSQYQSELSEKEKELREADEALARQRTILSSEAFKKKRQELEQRIGQLQRDIRTRKKELDQNYGEAMEKVQNRLIQIVQEIASDRNVDLVLNKATLVLVRPQMEITDIALKRLNRQLSSVNVPNPQN